MCIEVLRHHAPFIVLIHAALHFLTRLVDPSVFGRAYPAKPPSADTPTICCDDGKIHEASKVNSALRPL
jgi:hypothetical protein